MSLHKITVTALSKFNKADIGNNFNCFCFLAGISEHRFVKVLN